MEMYLVQAPSDVAIALDTLAAERSLPRLVPGSLYRMLDVFFGEYTFYIAR